MVVALFATAVGGEGAVTLPTTEVFTKSGLVIIGYQSSVAPSHPISQQEFSYSIILYLILFDLDHNHYWYYLKENQPVD